MQFKYETDRLVLKVLTENEADMVLDFYVDGDSYFGIREPERIDGFYTWDYQKCILKYEMENYLAKKSVRYYIFEKGNEHTIIGTVSLQNIKKGYFLSGQIGYKLLKDYTGRGYCTEAVKAISEIGFADYGLHKLIAYVQPDNYASIRVLEKSGFMQEGIARDYVIIGGKWQDHYIYSSINPA